MPIICLLNYNVNIFSRNLLVLKITTAVHMHAGDSSCRLLAVPRAMLENERKREKFHHSFQGSGVESGRANHFGSRSDIPTDGRRWTEYGEEASKGSRWSR